MRERISEDGEVARRSYGTGALYVRRDSRGRETWYGKWRVGGRQVKRRIGVVRRPGTRQGLTRAQAERELRRKVESTVPVVAAGERCTVEEAGEQLLDHLAALGRKPSTLNTYRSLLGAHLSPRLGGSSLDRIEPAHVERLVAAMRQGSAGAKLTCNALTLLYQVFEFGRRRGWCERNPVKQVDRPQVEEHKDIRFLAMEEVEALLAAVPETDQRDRSRVVPDGDDDRAAPGRAAGAALARRRLASGAPEGEAELRSWPLGNPEVTPRLAVGADGRPGRGRARAALPALAIPGRRGPGLSAPAHRRGPGPLGARQALQEGP
jgi:hypothetical protein